jgi:hypothetical protein
LSGSVIPLHKSVEDTIPDEDLDSVPEVDAFFSHVAVTLVVNTVLAFVLPGPSGHLLRELDIGPAEFSSGTFGENVLARGDQRGVFLKSAWWDPGLPGSVVFLFISSTGGVMVGRGVLCLRFFGCDGRLPLLVLYILLRSLKESVKSRGYVNSHRLGEVGAEQDSPLEQILFHGVRDGYLDCFFHEPLNIASERFVFPLNNGL